MREPSIFRGIAVSLLRPVIGSNVEIECRRCSKLGCWSTQTIQMIVQIFYFKFNSIKFIENSTFTVIIKLLHYWETPVQMVCLYNTSNCSFSVLCRPLFSLEAAVPVFASTSSTSMSFNNSLRANVQKNQTKSNFFGKAWKLHFAPLLHIASS